MKKKLRADLKILVVGTTGAGKTSFVNRWIKKEFNEQYKATIVSEFGIKTYENNDHLYRIQLWDIGGQDRSPSLTRIFAKDSFGCIVINDVNNEKCLEDTLRWKDAVYNESEFLDGEKLPFLLIQNKIDLINNENLEEIKEESKNIVEENNFIGYFLTSAKNNIGIDEAMNFIIENIIQRLEKYSTEGNQVFEDSQRHDTIQLDDFETESSKKNKKTQCC